MPPAPKLPFEGSTTYNAEFVPKRGERVEVGEVGEAAPKIPFQGQTSYSADYIRKPLADRSDLYPEAMQSPPVCCC